VTVILAATLVDTSALLKVVVASLAGGIGTTLAFSFMILGATRFAELRRDERPVEAAAFAAVVAVALATSVAIVVFGLIVMTSK
jgi:hypothetical protein